MRTATWRFTLDAYVDLARVQGALHSARTDLEWARAALAIAHEALRDA